MTLRTLSASAMFVLCLVAVSCGGGTSGNSSSNSTAQLPRLANAPIPTVTQIPPTAVTCGPDVPLPVPDDYPKADVPLPPDLVVWSVTRSPYLHIVGTVSPPIDPAQQKSWSVVAQAILGVMLQHGWTFSLNTLVEGADYELMSSDGRTGHLFAVPRPGCSGTVDLTLDFRWITG